ncbi:hypothetical protein V8B97DRAFT_1503139 [Scleroderma yunnanense]
MIYHRRMTDVFVHICIGHLLTSMSKPTSSENIVSQKYDRCVADLLVKAISYFLPETHMAHSTIDWIWHGCSVCRL